MSAFLPTIILRHRKENKKKCSLRGLVHHPEYIFLTYPQDSLPSLDGYIWLSLDAPPLTEKDSTKGLLLLDSTWKYEKCMAKTVPEGVERRSLPHTLVTAYPRKQTDCILPEQGLASIEALYAANAILGRNTDGILDTYHWKDAFLSVNGFEKHPTLLELNELAEKLNV